MVAIRGWSVVVLGIVCAAGGAAADDAASKETFAPRDADGDGRLTWAEAARGDASPEARRRYFLRDADGDGVLSAAEWSAQTETRTARNLFRGYDRDDSGNVTEVELLDGADAAREATLRHHLRVLDLDLDGGLSPEEFAGSPALVPREARGQLRDPIQDQCAATIQALHGAPESDGKWESFPLLDANSATAAVMWDASTLDANGDGTVTDDELRQAVELWWGLERPGGGPARFGDGRVFNEHFFRQIDVDKDRSLSFAELPRFARQARKELPALEALDRNGDQRLDLAELDAGRLFQADLFTRFCDCDRDRNGALSAEEVTSTARAWESRIAPRVLPAFDLDGNGELSLPEYLASPLADGTYFANEPRADRDDDGQLSLAEFTPPGPAAGLAAWYFSRLDLDHDGRLSHREGLVELQFGAVPAEIVRSVLDADGDQQVTHREAFGVEEPRDVLAAGSADVFRQLDVDADGRLSFDELLFVERLAAASERERVLRTEGLPAFQKRDADQDGALTLAEWLTGRTDAPAEAGKVFRNADVDADGRLALLEFARSAGAIPSTAVVAGDALDELVERRVTAVCAAAGNDRSVANVVAAAGQVQPELSAATVRGWDRNRDGRIDADEVRQGLDVAFGLREPGGRRLRFPPARQFNAHWFLGLDANHNGFVEQKEFVVKTRTPEELATSFAAADEDRNGRLSLGEATTISWCWSEGYGAFRKLDADGDGRLQRGELSGRLQSWERRFESRMFPCFDFNGDEGISLQEYLLSPLPASYRNWGRPSIDGDFNGSISLREFHNDESDFLLGLSAWYFSRLDTNQDGRLQGSEVDFTIDFKTAPLELVFRQFDTDRNAKLTLTETLALRGTKANRNQQMQAEDAYYAADVDRDGSLTSAEFTAPGAKIALLATGRPLPPSPRGGRRPAGAEAADAEGIGWDWKLFGLIGFNVLLVGGLAWYFLRSPG